jgi:predicted transposase/invertase (TIGR01784 family)
MTDEEQKQLFEELSVDPNIKAAIEFLKESNYTKTELEAYDRYWDSISSEKTLIFGAFDEGKLEGKLEGQLEGKLEATTEIAKTLKNAGIELSVIAKYTGLSEEEIEKL